MNKQERALKIIEALEINYPDAHCSLESRNALELLIATRLSAQCTDERVNIVTKDLFAKYKTAEDFASADISDIENIIHSCGLYKTKARDIVAMCKMLVNEYNSVVPDTIEELVKLPGVGRKTANLIVGDIYGKPSYVADTHCIRLSNRLGLANSKDPYKVEQELRRVIPPEKSGMFCHRLVWHGRAVCKARAPMCDDCCLREYCPRIGVK
ncbi:endonuclease III [[Clostridium] cellulosi]|uniref:Endonuclease III n=1 Tax=[Clostridium] cellulosi TaxID=29343 RepID=A0A078KVB4_9FIRM|nr:MAG: endonuclease III [[Clostridium] cellulosi]CDZ25135.1 endonuclease III [[Clostridium] cellulosi]